jgi:IclR family pca regulon transcriptional regulator
LADELDESVSLAVPDGDAIRFIHQATRRRALSLSFRIGDRLPAERTAPGPLFATEWTEEDWRVWHARRAADPRDGGFPAVPLREEPLQSDEFEDRVKRAARNGYVLDDQLIERGLVSVPVRSEAGPVGGGRGGGHGSDHAGRIVCVASVVSHTSRHTAEDLRRSLLPRLRQAVRAMEEDLSEAPPAQAQTPADLALWTGASKQEPGREFVESLARGLTVLTAFGEGRTALTLTEVAKATGLTRATARRALITYAHLGLVEQVPEGRFTLTPRSLSLGFPALSRTTLSRIATPHMTALTARIGESTSLAVLTEAGDEIQYVARVAANHVTSVDIGVGTRLPAMSTPMGRVLLLESVRTSGYALLDEELEQGLRSLAVPIRDHTGRAVASLDTATHVARRTRENCVRDLLPELRRTADEVEGDLKTAGRFTRIALT